MNRQASRTAGAKPSLDVALGSRMLKPLHSVVETWAPAAARLRPESDPLHVIASAWTSIVGETVARNSQPLALERGALVVATRSSAWSQQLQMLSETVLAEIGTLAASLAVERLVFRSGRLRTPVGLRARPVARSARAGRLGTSESGPESSEPGDARDAFERLRRRVATLRRAAGTTCIGCGAPLPDGRACAPCRGAAETARRVAAQRMMYSGSAVDFETTRLHVDGLTRDEYDSARRHVLRRWREMLERARIRGKCSRDGLEMRLASSYVLVQSRLPPERISTAIVRNALGEQLYEFLYGASAAPAAAKVESAKTRS